MFIEIDLGNGYLDLTVNVQWLTNEPYKQGKLLLVIIWWDKEALYLGKSYKENMNIVWIHMQTFSKTWT